MSLVDCLESANTCMCLPILIRVILLEISEIAVKFQPPLTPGRFRSTSVDHSVAVRPILMLLLVQEDRLSVNIFVCWHMTCLVTVETEKLQFCIPLVSRYVNHFEFYCQCDKTGWG